MFPFDAKRLVATLAVVTLFAACAKTPEEKYAQYMASGESFFEAQDFASALIEYKNAARVQPQDGEAFYRIGQTQLSTAAAHGRTGDTPLQIVALRAAVEAYDQALKNDPKHREASLALSRLLLTVGGKEDLVEAEAAARGLVELDGSDADALFELARVKARQAQGPDDYPAIEGLLRDSLAQAPGGLRPAMALAEIAMAAGDPDKAEQTLAEALEGSSDKPSAHTAMARFYLRQQRTDDAREQFRLATEADDSYVPAKIGLGLLAMQAGDDEEAEANFRQAADLGEGLTKLAYGRFLATRGRLDDAAEEFRRLVTADAGDHQARVALVATLERQEKFAEAVAALDERIASAPGDEPTLLARGALYLRRMELPNAENDLRQVLIGNPRSAPARYLLAQVHLARRDAVQYEAELENLLQVNPLHLGGRIALGQHFLGQGETDEAIEVLENAPPGQLSGPQLQAALIQSYIQAKDHEAARQALDKALEAETPAAQFEFLDGALKRIQGDHEGALAAFERALERAPAHQRALQSTAASYAERDGLAKAVAWLESHVAAHVDNPAVQSAAGTFFAQVKRPDLARRAFQAVIELNAPNVVDAKLALGQLEQVEGNLEAAAKPIDEVLARQPDNPRALALKGVLHGERGNEAWKAFGRDIGEPVRYNWRDELDISIEAFEKLLRIQPDHVIALNNLAMFYAVQYGKIDEGLEYAERAKRAAPESGAVDDTLGWIYYLKGLYPRAVEHLLRAADAYPNEAVVHYHLSMAHAKAGSFRAATESYERGLELDPDLLEASEARQALGL